MSFWRDSLTDNYRDTPEYQRVNGEANRVKSQKKKGGFLRRLLEFLVDDGHNP